MSHYVSPLMAHKINAGQRLEFVESDGTSQVVGDLPVVVAGAAVVAAGAAVVSAAAAVYTAIGGGGGGGGCPCEEFQDVPDTYLV